MNRLAQIWKQCTDWKVISTTSVVAVAALLKTTPDALLRKFQDSGIAAQDPQQSLNEISRQTKHPLPELLGIAMNDGSQNERDQES